MGARGTAGAQLASYLMFESSFTRELIALGYEDTMQQREDVSRFWAARRWRPRPCCPR